MSRVLYNSENRITNGYNPSSHKGVDLCWYYDDFGNYDEETNRVYPNCKGVVAYLEDGLGNMEGASGWGNFVLIKHPNGMYSRYAHLQKGLNVVQGQEVDENTILGHIGDSGYAYGMHLHYEVQTGWDCATRIDPTPYLTQAIWEEAPQPTPQPSEDKYYMVNSPNGLLLLDDNYARIDGYAYGAVVKYLADGYDLIDGNTTYHYYKVQTLCDGNIGYMASEFLTPCEKP